MKNIITGLLLLMAMAAGAQTYTEKINHEFTLEKKTADNALIIANINGHVTVTGYAGDKIIVEVTKTVYAKTNERLEKGKTELQLGVKDLADTLILYVQMAGDCNSFGRRYTDVGNKRYRNSRHGGWGYQWNNNGNCDGCKAQYDFTLDFVVKVPETLHVLASTVNKGDIAVRSVKGMVDADNVNGSVSVADLAREARLTTINGDVTIDCEKNPANACRFYTLNGDINANFRKGLAADLSFESFNGEFYTDIDGLKPLPISLEKTTDSKGVKFKVSGSRYRIGTGGPLLDFETFNGNVYLRTN
jgi:hypothetical protein